MSQQIWLKVTKTNGMFSIQVVDKLSIIATLPLVWKSYICQTVTMSHQFFQIFGQDDGFQIAKALLENAISIESDAETKTYLESRLAELLREIAERQKPRIPKVEKILKICPICHKEVYVPSRQRLCDDCKKYRHNFVKVQSTRLGTIQPDISRLRDHKHD